MIVRVFTEGQYEIEDGAIDRLRELDEQTQKALETGDEAGFRSSYDALLKVLRDEGTPLADDDLRGSDLMLPPPDITLEEAQAEFSDHGLIPD
jgi:PspA-Associated protein